MRISLCVYEGLAQRGDAISGDAGRRHEWASHHLPCENKFQNRLLFGRLGEIHHQRHVRQIGMFRQRKLNEHVDLLVTQPLLLGRNHTRPRPAAPGCDFAAFHGQVNIIAAGITNDDAHFRAQHAVEDFGKLVCIGAAARAADHQLLLERILKRGDARRVPGDAHTDLIIHAADPVEFCGIKL